MTDLQNLITQLNEQVKRKTTQISAIHIIAATIGLSLDLDVTLNTAISVVMNVVGAEAAGISLIDDQTQEVVLRAQEGWLNDFVKKNPMRVPPGQGMSGEVIRRNDAIVDNNLTDEHQFAVPGFGKERFRSIAMAPMHARGQIIGILSVMSHHANRFDDEIVETLQSIADTVGMAINNARLHEKHVENEDRLKAILESTADGILAVDQNGVVREINPAASRLLQIPSQTLIGTTLSDAPIPADLRAHLVNAMQPHAQDSDKTFRVALDSNHEIQAIVSTVRMPSQVVGDKEEDGFVAVLQDITHFRQEELARAQFIQAAAHDMKNPLSVTQSSLHTLSSLLDTSDPMIQEVMTIAHAGITRLQRLIDDLMQIEKIESGYGFYREDVDLRELGYELSAQIKPLMKDKGLQYELAIDEEHLPRALYIDREWIQRALFNYLENAAKYHRTNGAVQLRIYRADNTVRFEVVDNGPGIPRSAQARVFDRFYRVENRRDVRGSGLGLAIVKSVAEAHNGGVYVHSQENVGSTFGLWLPLEG
jgi:two-component system phosphate regulon sensor histidine kinase PhoR